MQKDNIRWFNCLYSDDKPCLLKSKLITSKNLIVSLQYKINDNYSYKYTSFEDYIHFWQYYLSLSPSQQTFNEITMENQLQKLRFDLDMKNVTDRKIGDKVIEEIILATNKFFLDLNVKLKLENKNLKSLE